MPKRFCLNMFQAANQEHPLIPTHSFCFRPRDSTRMLSCVFHNIGGSSGNSVAVKQWKEARKVGEEVEAVEAMEIREAREEVKAKEAKEELVCGLR